jgi:hypothetical protein
VLRGSLILRSLDQDAGPGPFEFSSEDLLGNDGLLDAPIEGTDIIFLISLLLPVDPSQAEVHYLDIEAQPLRNLH